MADDLNRKLQAQLDELRSEVERLKRANPLERISVTAGRVRFIGGLLLIDSGGTLQVIGRVTGQGRFEWEGPWEFDSPDGGRIAGDVALDGDFDLTGKLTSDGIRIENGKIYVGEGASQIVIDGATGEITAGNVTIEPDKITVGAGGSSATLQNGELELANGAKLAVGLTGGASSIGLIPGGGVVDISASGLTAWMRAIGSAISVGTSMARIAAANVFMPDLPELTSLSGLRWVAADGDGRLGFVPQSLGGPIGGPLDWPFPESLVTSEYGPRDTGFHEGIDFGNGIANVAGTPIPAAASGTVVEAVTLHPGWGNYVKLDHGGGIQTLYAHMVDPPLLAVNDHVARGQTVGGIGNTGASQGNHLHFEVWVNGVTVNPRTKLP